MQVIGEGTGKWHFRVRVIRELRMFNEKKIGRKMEIIGSARAFPSQFEYAKNYPRRALH